MSVKPFKGNTQNISFLHWHRNAMKWLDFFDCPLYLFHFATFTVEKYEKNKEVNAHIHTQKGPQTQLLAHCAAFISAAFIKL